MNCVSTAEAVGAHVLLAGAVVAPHVHEALGRVGVVAAPSIVARDAHTLTFLRGLDLDPVEILGHSAVAAAEHFLATDGYGRRARSAAARRSSALAIGSHRRPALQ